MINECLPELEKIVKEGKAKFIGVTAYPLSRLKECIEQAPGRFDVSNYVINRCALLIYYFLTPDFPFPQSVLAYARYTLLDDSLKSYLDFFQKQNLGIVCASGHALGLLTNAGPQVWHPAGEEVKDICRKAANICKEANVELGKLAMYYFMQLDGVSTFLTGMQTRKLLDINLSAYHSGLTKKEQEVLQLLRETYV